MLVLLNTSGGDGCRPCYCRDDRTMSIPVVSLVLGGSHSIVYRQCIHHSFIVPSGTMMVHPVRMSGMVIGTARLMNILR
ncbi:MAG: hypothetical protein ACLTMD_09455 [Clostridium sp.]